MDSKKKYNEEGSTCKMHNENEIETEPRRTAFYEWGFLRSKLTALFATFALRKVWIIFVYRLHNCVLSYRRGSLYLKKKLRPRDYRRLRYITKKNYTVIIMISG